MCTNARLHAVLTCSQLAVQRGLVPTCSLHCEDSKAHVAILYHPVYTGSAGSLAEHGQCCGIVSLDYAPSLQSLAVVFEDGRCAVCRTPEGGLLPVEGVQLSHFICRAGSGAVCACIGLLPCAQQEHNARPGASLS